MVRRIWSSLRCEGREASIRNWGTGSRNPVVGGHGRKGRMKLMDRSPKSGRLVFIVVLDPLSSLNISMDYGVVGIPFVA